jgi:hypothetical protein
MRFLITGTDTAGSVTVRRDLAEAALKKAAELGSRRLLGYQDHRARRAHIYRPGSRPTCCTRRSCPIQEQPDIERI